MTEPSLPFGSSRPTRRTLLGTAGAVGAAAVVGAAPPPRTPPPRPPRRARPT
ncbi:twin-arginine translocation signal domain-containing protein, partial [Streptomyces sp. NPDC088184]|uniref:twin-arginine translocation signal domain-containing protein n=1 Tax=Streptomyces sp. NPDC088184 TaxID=3160991 RepID=UPI0034463EA3